MTSHERRGSAVGARTRRALPPVPYLPGVGVRPDPGWLTHAPPWPWAVDLFDGGYFWEAHEVWESMWIELPRSSPRARFLQGLLLCAGAMVKQSAGYPEAADALFLQAVEALEEAVFALGDVIDGVDVLEFVALVDLAMHDGPLPHVPQSER